jgi:hypothetical protein
MVAGFSNGTGIVAPTERSQALCTIKSDFLNLIHQADITVNGRSVESTQPYIHIVRHFQLISGMSVNDLATLGHSLALRQLLIIPKPQNINLLTEILLQLVVMVYLMIEFASASENQTAVGAQNTSIGNAANQ